MPPETRRVPVDHANDKSVGDSILGHVGMMCNIEVSASGQSSKGLWFQRPALSWNSRHRADARQDAMIREP